MRNLISIIKHAMSFSAIFAAVLFGSACFLAGNASAGVGDDNTGITQMMDVKSSSDSKAFFRDNDRPFFRDRPFFFRGFNPFFDKDDFFFEDDD